MFKKIKKSVAVFTVVLMMSSSLNAVNYDCFVASDNLASAYGDYYGWNHGQEYAAFIVLYDTCVGGIQ